MLWEPVFLWPHPPKYPAFVPLSRSREIQQVRQVRNDLETTRLEMKKPTGKMPVGRCEYYLLLTWQARRDSNPQPSDLESDALAVRATGLQEAHFITGLQDGCKAKTASPYSTMHPQRDRSATGAWRPCV